MQQPDLSEVKRVLEQTAHQPAESVARNLASLGPDAIAPLFALLASGRAVESEPALLLALERLPFPAVRELLVGLSHQSPDEHTRRAALRVLAELGGAEELRLAIAFSTPDGEESVARPQRLAFAAAIESILRREPLGIRVLADEFPVLHPSLVSPTLRAIGRCDTLAALSVLIGLLESVPGTDVLILNEVARLGRQAPKPVEERLGEGVLAFLSSVDRATLTEAARAAGTLESHAAVSALIALLEHEALGVRDAAHRSLLQITGTRLDRDPETWRLWHEREQRWWNVEARARLAAAHSSLPSEASSAILELSHHTLFRHEIADALGASLNRSETDLVRMSCAALGQLGSWRALPALIEMLGGSSEPETAQAAHRALVRITGRDLGADPEAWRSSLQSGNARVDD
jgi:HEAT repeat protein